MKQTAEETEALKQLILEKAKIVFAEKGYAMTNMQDIAAAANVSRGPLYYHYKNKQVLFNSVVELHYKRAYEKLEGIFQQDIPLLEKIRLDLKSCLSNVQFSGMVQTLLSMSSREDFEEVHTCYHEYLNKAYAMKCKWIEKAVQTGEVRLKLPASAVVDFIFANYSGLRGWKNDKKELTDCSGYYEMDQDTMIDTIVECFNRVFFA